MDDDLCQAVSAMNAEGERRGHPRVSERSRGDYLHEIYRRMTGDGPFAVTPYVVAAPRHWVERQ